MATRKSRASDLARRTRELRGHPLADSLVEDLAAARLHGRETARVAIEPDGNPIVYGRDREVVRRIGRAIQQSTHVHTRPIPELTEQDYEILLAQADAKLLPDGQDDE